ncbi:MAG TPA: outer membrane lipid asymmetry maintenance protein MlaD [Aestuariivirgaceae bacterium]|nr:outer membrane lipid asymmetry maintenance protein MlaD [Aestuariivirgaceae bacterium]
MHSNTVETVVGALVIAIAAAFFFYVYTTTNKAVGSGGYHLSAEFDNIGSVAVGTDVRVAGIKVGTVTSQDLNPESYQARIVMTIDPKVHLADDSSAKVTSEGLLGANYIAVDPGGSETKLEDGGEIQNTQGAVDFWKLVSETMFSQSRTGGATESGGGAAPGAQSPEPQAPETQPQDAPAPDGGAAPEEPAGGATGEGTEAPSGNAQ